MYDLCWKPISSSPPGTVGTFYLSSSPDADSQPYFTLQRPVKLTRIQSLPVTYHPVRESLSSTMVFTSAGPSPLFPRFVNAAITSSFRANFGVFQSRTYTLFSVGVASGTAPIAPRSSGGLPLETVPAASELKLRALAASTPAIGPTERKPKLAVLASPLLNQDTAALAVRGADMSASLSHNCVTQCIVYRVGRWVNTCCVMGVRFTPSSCELLYRLSLSMRHGVLSSCKIFRTHRHRGVFLTASVTADTRRGLDAPRPVVGR